jgi:zinc and cadmium transporter
MIIPAFASVLAVSLISFVGVFGLSVKRNALKKTLLILVSFAAGGLFGDVFLHLLPEAFAESDGSIQVPLLVIAGILIFFVLEKFVRWRHCHTPDEGHHTHPVAVMNLIGDGVHNFIDGLLIGASYLVSFPIGFATTVAVILHEIPSEIGDFGVLLHSGMSVKKVLTWNFVSALMAILGPAIAVKVGPSVEGFAEILIPITAGGFLYVAGSDLIPELHEEVKPSLSVAQLMAMIVGIWLMVLLRFME